MIEARWPQSINELERHFDEALARLRVYELPLSVALRASLAAFEEWHSTVADHTQERPDAFAAMLHCKGALEILMPNLFKRCRPQVGPEQLAVVAASISESVADALHFCQRYHFAVHAYTLYHQKQFTGSLCGRLADFRYSKGFTLGRSSLSLRLHNYHEQRSVDGSRLSGMLLPSTDPGGSREALVTRLRCTDPRSILDSPPDDIYIPIRQIVEAATPGPTVDTTASCGDYSIGDFRDLWIEFMVRMSAYSLTCEERSKIDDSFNLLEHRILRLTLPELAEILANRGAVDINIAQSILPDLVFDTEASRPDVLVQPLVPMPDTRSVLVAPSLISTANWEVCVLRNWTRLYREIYGKVIAGKKGELANSLGNALASKSFVTSVNRDVTDGEGQTIGDVDVACFDASDGLLVMFEIKWLIEPDSVREAVRTDDEISHAFEQAIRCRRAFENDNRRFLKELFPDCGVSVSAVNEVRCYVVARGDLGNKDDEENDIQVLDYLLTTETIAQFTGAPLRQIIARIVDRQAEISRSIEEGAYPLQINLAGYLIRLPGYSTAARPIIKGKPDIKKPGRNERCTCGSGRKYKKCCLELASYDGDVL